MKRSKTSKAWMQAHVNDPWVRRAQAEGYRSRAAYKLLEIDQRDRLLRPGQVVVDLGAAPGSWSQVAARRLAPGGRVLALDLLEMAPIAGVEFLRGDFMNDKVVAELDARLAGAPVSLVLSDMAPNLSGIASADQARSVHLAELALEFAAGRLAPGGRLLVKVFQGSGFMEFRRSALELFRRVEVRKPKASRERSPEVYLLAAELKPLPDPDDSLRQSSLSIARGNEAP